MDQFCYYSCNFQYYFWFFLDFLVLGVWRLVIMVLLDGWSKRDVVFDLGYYFFYLGNEGLEFICFIENISV